MQNVYPSRQDALALEIIPVLETVGGFTDEQTEAIADRIVTATPAGFMLCSPTGGDLSSEQFWQIAAAFGPDADDFTWQMTRDADERDLMSIMDEDGFIIDLIRADADDDEGLETALAEAGWALIEPSPTMPEHAEVERLHTD